MAKNNWANEAFKKAQNLMSRGYNDFEPTTVVSKDQLSDLKTVLLSDEQIARDNEHQPAPWYQFPDEKETPKEEYEAETHAYDPDNTPVQGIDFEGQARELNTERFDVWDGSESEAGKWARDNGLLKKRPDEDYHSEKELKMAVQLVEKEIQKNSYNMFTSQTQEEKAYKDKRLEGLKREKRRLVEKYQAKSWKQGGSKENIRKAGVAVKDVLKESVYTGPLSPTKHNNPGNIKKTDIKWDGEGTETYGDGFTSFDSPEAGISAMTKDLTTKLKRHNGDLKAMISEYAPASDGNDIKKYMKVVKKTAGDKYRYTEEDIQNIVKGFIRMENKKETADYYINIMEK